MWKIADQKLSFFDMAFTMILKICFWIITSVEKLCCLKSHKFQIKCRDSAEPCWADLWIGASYLQEQKLVSLRISANTSQKSNRSLSVTFSHRCMKVRPGPHVIILHLIFDANMEVLCNWMYSWRFLTAYHYIRRIFKRQEEALFKLFCMKERLGPHVMKVYCLLLYLRSLFVIPRWLS